MKKLTCISPVNGQAFAERNVLTLDEMQSRLGYAKTARAAWMKISIGERKSIVEKAINYLADMNEDITLEIANMMGRPVRYGGEIGGVKERAFHMISIAEQALADNIIEKSDQFHRYIARVPLGNILVIAPWNYPYLTAVNAIVPALIAGNSVFLKHSTQTLLAGERFQKAFDEAGLPDGLFQNVFLDHETTSDLIGVRAFDYVNFTGSVGGGRSIEKAAAGTFTGVGLELGGKDPGYVRADANLDSAVDTLIDGAMFNSGQCCCGIERIYVHESIYDDFVEKATTIVNGYVLGDPLSEKTTLGPMAHKKFADEVRDQISEALSAGAKVLINPANFPRDNGSDAYLAPQILVDVDHSMRIMRDESFGPVVGIMKVSNDDEAIALMNDSEFGLSASIWTNDLTVAEAIGNQLETGTVFMNRCDYLDPALCWTGCKNTGRGASLSVLGYHSVTRPKSFHLKRV